MIRFKFLLLLVVVTTHLAYSQTTRVLFLGNSYTAVNSLPYLVSALSLSKGDTMITDSYTPGGYTFELHSADTNSINKIYSQQWDYVVLQEQSQRPSFPPSQVAVEVYPYATLLDSMVHDNNSCTESVFYMTWGRKNGDASNCASWPPVCTYEGMQARLRESYMEMALQNNSTVSPVGAAFSYVRSLNPTFDLYSPDESHPSIHGSYLAACVFYSTIFHKSPVGASFISTISQQDAAILQAAAKTVVIDSLQTWYEYGNIPYSNFSYTTLNQIAQFQNNSINNISSLWNFGDGANSSVASPVHSYNQNGTYIVTLTSSTNCRSDVYVDIVFIGATSLEQHELGCNLFFDYFSQTLKTDCSQWSYDNINLFDIQGRQINKSHFTEQTTANFKNINFSNLSSGIYFLQVRSGQYSKALKIVIAAP